MQRQTLARARTTEHLDRMGSRLAAGAVGTEGTRKLSHGGKASAASVPGSSRSSTSMSSSLTSAILRPLRETTSRTATEPRTTLPRRLPAPRLACWAWPVKDAYHNLTVFTVSCLPPLQRSCFMQLLCTSHVQHSSLTWNLCATALRAGMNSSYCSRALTDFRWMPALVASSSKV